MQVTRGKHTFWPLNRVGKRAWIGAMFFPIIALITVYTIMAVSPHGHRWPWLFPSVALEYTSGRMASNCLVPLTLPFFTIIAGLRYLIAAHCIKDHPVKGGQARQHLVYVNNASLAFVVIGTIAIIGVVAITYAENPVGHYTAAALLFLFMSADAPAQIWLDHRLGKSYAPNGPRNWTGGALMLACVLTVTAQVMRWPEAMSVTELLWLVVLGVWWFPEKNRYSWFDLAVAVTKRNNGEPMENPFESFM